MSQSQYATVAQLQTLAITQDQAARFGVPAMTMALQAASSLSDSYLASQFTLPLKTSPQGWDMSLTEAVCNIAAYKLAAQFGFAPMAPGDELVKQRYMDALQWLSQIRNKEIFPQFTDSGTTTPGNDEGGNWVLSDPAVGFTPRGVNDTIDDAWSWSDQ